MFHMHNLLAVTDRKIFYTRCLVSFYIQHIVAHNNFLKMLVILGKDNGEILYV